MKYKFTGETTYHCGRTLHLIQRTDDEHIGGWIESGDNLSEDYYWFTYEDVKVCDITHRCKEAFRLMVQVLFIIAVLYAYICLSSLIS